MRECFHDIAPVRIFREYSASEAIAKIKGYEEEQKCKKCGYYPADGKSFNAICLKCVDNDKFTTHETLLEIQRLLEVENERLRNNIKEYEKKQVKAERICSMQNCIHNAPDNPYCECCHDADKYEPKPGRKNEFCPACGSKMA